ncbi:MAG: tetratricopeptide repeat protein, partial [Planctomycetes bacterium]|nr:tetratricopeptide repeat protein [Planctomycetota bacterium]
MIRALLALAGVLLVGCGHPAPPAVVPAPAASVDPAVARIDAALPRFRTPQAVPEPQHPRVTDAVQALAAGDLAGARAILLPVVAARPGDAWPRFLLALTHHKEKRYAEARPLLEAVIDGPCSHPGLVSAFYFEGWCLQNLGELDGARAAFAAAVELEPGNADARFGLGLVQHERREHEEARKHL